MWEIQIKESYGETLWKKLLYTKLLTFLFQVEKYNKMKIQLKSNNKEIYSTMKGGEIAGI